MRCAQAMSAPVACSYWPGGCPRLATHRLPDDDTERHVWIETDAALCVVRLDVVHRLDVGNIACALSRGARGRERGGAL